MQLMAAFPAYERQGRKNLGDTGPLLTGPQGALLAGVLSLSLWALIGLALGQLLGWTSAA